MKTRTRKSPETFLGQPIVRNRASLGKPRGVHVCLWLGGCSEEAGSFRAEIHVFERTVWTMFWQVKTRKKAIHLAERSAAKALRRLLRGLMPPLGSALAVVDTGRK